MTSNTAIYRSGLSVIMKTSFLSHIAVVFISIFLSACSKGSTVIESLTTTPTAVVSTVSAKVSDALKVLTPTQIQKTIKSLRADVVKSKAVGSK